MKIKPLHDRVLVRRLEEEEKSSGGIIIPPTPPRRSPPRAKSWQSAPAFVTTTANASRWT